MGLLVFTDCIYMAEEPTSDIGLRARAITANKAPESVSKVLEMDKKIRYTAEVGEVGPPPVAEESPMDVIRYSLSSEIPGTIQMSFSSGW